MSKPTILTTATDKPDEKDKFGMTADDWKAFDAKSDEDIAADVAADPDAAPIRTGPSKARRISFAKHVRQKLAMTRERFAADYGIPLETLEAWERHDLVPTAVELAYLRLIEREPERAKLDTIA